MSDVFFLFQFLKNPTMSYSPTFAILKADLHKHEKYIFDGTWQYSDDQHSDEYQVLTELQFYMTKTTPLTLGKSLGQPIDFYLISMEFSSQNVWLRDWLLEFEIEYSTTN